MDRQLDVFQDCARCDAVLRENAELTEEVSGLLATTRRQARTIAALEGRLRKLAADDPASVDVLTVLENWRHNCGHPKAKIPLDGKRAQAVKRWLRSYTVAELLEAIEGAALAPYDAGFGKRKVHGTREERKDDLLYVLRDEGTIERFRGIAQRAKRASSAVLFAVWEQHSASEKMYLSLALSALGRERAMSAEEFSAHLVEAAA